MTLNITNTSIYKFLFFLIVVFYCLVLSQFGFENFDTGYIPSFSWRIINGQSVYQDFMINDKGKEVCAIVKLKSRINGHKATISEDYQRLKAIVMEKRSEDKLEKWIKEKQKHTYVRINEKWQKCDFKYPGWIKE